MWPGAACPGGAGNPIKNLPGRSVPCTCWGQGWGEQQLGPTGTHCILQVAGKNNPCLGQLQLLLRVIPSQLIPALPCLSLELGSLLVAFPTWERCWELSVPTCVLPGLAGVPCVGTVLLCVALPAQHLPELGGASRPCALLSPSRVSPRNADCFGFSGHSTATGHKGLSVSERSASSFLWILESFWGLLWPLGAILSPGWPGAVSPLPSGTRHCALSLGCGTPKLSPWQAQGAVRRCSAAGRVAGGTAGVSHPGSVAGAISTAQSVLQHPEVLLPSPAVPLAGKARCCGFVWCRERSLALPLLQLQGQNAANKAPVSHPQPVTSSPSPSCFLVFLIFFFPSLS